MLAIVALIACACPATAELGAEIEKGIGNWMAQAFIAQRGRLDQPPIEDWVARVGRELLEHTTRPDLDYRFVVLDSPEANGFALPGGWIFITAGLLESMDSEDELAGVIAHELGHHAQRDFQRVLLRTALWLGLAEVLRGSDRGDWVPVVQAGQLIETLSHSRRREAQADAFGAQLAWDAGYDPRAMAAFLGDAPKWSYLQTIFSTHPHPARRSDRLNERFARLRAEDPDGALALSRSLLDRGRRGRAADVLSEPLAPEREAERAAMLRQIEAGARAVAREGGASLTADRLAAVDEALSAAKKASAGARETRELAWTRLRRLWDDRQVQRGLIVAQAVEPNLNDPAYLLLVARSVNVLHRAMRGGNLVARTLGMGGETTDGLTALGDALRSAEVEPERIAHLLAEADAIVERAAALSAEAAPQSEELARLAGRYHETARLISPLLVELALSGEGQPAGRMTFARFMLIEARVRHIDDRLRRLDDALDAVAADAWRATIDVHRLRLNLATLMAADDAREAIFSTLARRTGTEAEQFRGAWGAGTMPGDRMLELLAEIVPPDAAGFSRQLRATQILIRIGFIEVKEQVAWSEKGKAAMEGAGTRALRSAVRYPQ